MKKTIFKAVVFAVIFVAVFSRLSELFCRKSLEGEWNTTQKTAGFYNEPENEFDVMFFGSSNAYCSFNPLVLYESAGIKSYVFATQQQPAWATYAYIKDALKTQKPQLLAVDVLMFSKSEEYYDDGVNYSFMDDMPLSANKLCLAAVSAPRGERIRLLVNFIKYHSRWSELTEEDYTFKRSEAGDYLKGYTLLTDTFPDGSLPAENNGKTAPLAEKELYYLEKIIKLASENDIPLYLVRTPSNATEEEQMLFNSVAETARERQIEYVNYNDLYEEIGLDIMSDFYDKSHLNYRGAEKFTRYFAEDMLSKFRIVPKRSNANDDEWNAATKKYYDFVAEKKSEE